jgi:hypothetical protein
MGRAKAKATAALASKRGHDDLQSPLTPTPLGSNGNFESSKVAAGLADSRSKKPTVHSSGDVNRQDET